MATSLHHDAHADEDHKLILASRVEHVPVFDDTGHRIGHIDDLSIDRKTGQTVYAIMSFGGFLGIGKRFHPLPWDRLHYDSAMGGYLVDVDRKTLEAAPHYSAEQLEPFGGPHTHTSVTAVYGYYGSGPPYL